MTVTVYWDVIFIVNFIIDALLLFVTSFFLKKRNKTIKILLAASVGALFAAIIFFLSLPSFFVCLISVFVSFLMVFFAFGAKSVSLFFKNVSLFYLISFIIGGLGFWALMLLNTYAGLCFFINAGILYLDINAYTVLACFLSALFIIHIATGFLKKQRIKSHFLYDVTIEKNGKFVTHTALYDTGNFLKDPISQKSVLISEWNAVSPLFSCDTLKEYVAQNPHEFIYIPMRSVGTKTGVFAFLPDRILSQSLVFPGDVYVGISETSLDKEGTYQMLLPNDTQISGSAERI